MINGKLCVTSVFPGKYCSPRLRDCMKGKYCILIKGSTYVNYQSWKWSPELWIKLQKRPLLSIICYRTLNSLETVPFLKNNSRHSAAWVIFCCTFLHVVVKSVIKSTGPKSLQTFQYFFLSQADRMKAFLVIFIWHDKYFFPFSNLHPFTTDTD